LFKELKLLIKDQPLKIAGREFKSRFLIGTGKFSSPEILSQTIENAQCEIVTVAIRRANPQNPLGDPAMRGIDPEKILILPNTSGARNKDEAVRIARLGRALTGHSWVKLEVTPDPASLLPDPIESLKAAELLVKEGFFVLPYINADPILAKRMEEVGTVTVMPLAAPIGTNKGMTTRELIGMIIESANVPVIVDAGLGLPSHAAEAMEMGASAVLVNTALATAGSPQLMATAFRQAVLAGRNGFLAGKGKTSEHAQASSPLTGFLRE
jgi:thiazole synthase